MVTDKVLKEFDMQYWEKVRYKADEDLFYRVSEGGVETPVRMNRFDTQNKPNATEKEYERELTGADKRLREIIMEHVEWVVGEDLVREGHMAHGNGSYISITRGACNILWKRKKEMLMEKYNIGWNSPPEQQPGIFLD